jgi:hypothetical protein
VILSIQRVGTFLSNLQRITHTRVGLPTDPEGKEPNSYGRYVPLPHRTLRYGGRLPQLPSAEREPLGIPLRKEVITLAIFARVSRIAKRRDKC